MKIPRVFVLAFCVISLCILFRSVSSAATVEEVALMKSANREKSLIEGAKKEGKITLYTGLIVDQVVRPVKDAFEKEYPFIQLEFFRGNTERLAQRMLAEYQAKRYESLDAIAKKHGLTLAELKQANDSVKLDKKGKLRQAGPILVPMRKGATAMACVPAAAQPARVASLSVPTAAAGSVPTRAVAPPASKTYVVRAGDTLYSIAKRFDTAVDILLELNRLTAKTVLHPGLKLRLP